MSKKLTCIVTDRETGKIIVRGPMRECGKVIGMSYTWMLYASKRSDNSYRKYKGSKNSKYKVTVVPYHFAGSRDKYYAMYRAATDEIVCSGTARECSEFLGIAVNTFYSMVSKWRSGVRTKWEFYIEPYYAEGEKREDYYCGTDKR